MLSATLVTGLAWAWWPYPGNYRPIVPGEQNLFTSLLPTARSAPGPLPTSPDAALLPGTRTLPVGQAAQRRLADQTPLQATFPGGQALPTQADPQLALVLVPTTPAPDQPTPSTPPDGTDQPDGTESEPWVFPFDQPLPPEDGDNQAAAYNTTDDSLTYDVAFALVWATGDEVLNVNEAHAYASCSRCVTVAVAFQVVLIMDDAQVVVPQNLAVAANYQCYRCITAAIANQLVLSVTHTPGQEQLLALAAVWDQLTEFGHNITTYTLTQIADQLDSIKTQIQAILHTAPPLTPAPTSTPSQSATGAPDTDTRPSPTTPSGSPSPSPTGAPSSSPTGAPSPSGATSQPTAPPPSGSTTAPASPPPSPAPTTSSPSSPSSPSSSTP